MSHSHLWLPSHCGCLCDSLSRRRMVEAACGAILTCARLNRSTSARQISPAVVAGLTGVPFTHFHVIRAAGLSLHPSQKHVSTMPKVRWTAVVAVPTSLRGSPASVSFTTGFTCFIASGGPMGAEAIRGWWKRHPGPNLHVPVFM